MRISLSLLERWRATTTNTVWSSPAVTDGVIYWGDGDGAIHLTDRSTGAELDRFFTGGQVHSSPVPDGDLLFVGSGDGRVYAIRLGTVVVHRAVFFNWTYLRIATVADAADLAQALASRGYQLLDASALPDFLRARLADRAPSVVAFAIDALPDGVLPSGAPPAQSLFRQYLEAGSKVVWVGLPPAIWPVEPHHGERTGLDQVAWSAPGELLGVSHDAAMFDRRGARSTEEGRRWGLPPRWRSGWSVAPSAVSTVLALDDWSLAAAWVKNYGGSPGTGFVRVPARTAAVGVPGSRVPA